MQFRQSLSSASDERADCLLSLSVTAVVRLGGMVHGRSFPWLCFLEVLVWNRTRIVPSWLVRLHAIIKSDVASFLPHTGLLDDPCRWRGSQSLGTALLLAQRALALCQRLSLNTFWP